jgi:hypothetical protein
MIQSTDVAFRTIDVPMETGNDADNVHTMDVIEINYPDGKVIAFPADMKSPETGKRYREMYPEKYDAFKSGHIDPDRAEQLKREIADRQAELDGANKGPDDQRLRENLGYDRDPKEGEDPHNATKPDPVEEPAPVLGPDPVKPPPNDFVAHDEPKVPA